MKLNLSNNVISRPTVSPMSFTKWFVVPSLLLLGFNQQAQAGAWVADEGKGYIKLGQSTYKADKFKSKDGFDDPNREFNEFEGQNTSLYFEHGLGSN